LKPATTKKTLKAKSSRRQALESGTVLSNLHCSWCTVRIDGTGEERRCRPSQFESKPKSIGPGVRIRLKPREDTHCKSTESVKRKLICAICRQQPTSMNPIEFLPCEHLIHIACLNKHLLRPKRCSRNFSSSGLADCPMCKTDFIPQKRHRLNSPSTVTSGLVEDSLLFDHNLPSQAMSIIERYRPNGPAHLVSAAAFLRS